MTLHFSLHLKKVEISNTFYLCDLKCRCKTLIIVLFSAINSYILKGIDFFFFFEAILPQLFVDTFAGLHVATFKSDQK